MLSEKTEEIFSSLEELIAVTCFGDSDEFDNEGYLRDLNLLRERLMFYVNDLDELERYTREAIEEENG